MRTPPQPTGYRRVSHDELEEFARDNLRPIRLPGPQGGWAKVNNGVEGLCSLLGPATGWEEPA